MSAKRRRSKRSSKSERVLLSLTTPPALQDIVVTIEASAHGAKVLARRKMTPDAKGTALLISSGRQVPCRVAWQRPPGADGRMETGIEIDSNSNFWGLDLSGSEVEPEPEPVASAAPVVPAVPAMSVAMLLEELGKHEHSSGLPVKLWCAVVEALEGKGVFTRDELIAMLKKLGSSN
jgi:hypothetical protein